MKNSNRAKIWKRFIRLLLVGSSLLVLLYAAQTSVFQNVQDVQAIQVCTETTRDFPQCGGTVGLEGKDPTHTFIVREFTTVVTPQCPAGKRFAVVEDKGNLGQCQVVPPPACQPTKREFPQCGGTVGLESFPKTDTIIVTEVTDCNGNKTFPRELLVNKGNLGQCQQSCTETTRDFPQCGGTVGLESKDKTHTFIVREFTNTCTQAKRFEVVEDKGNLGQCQQPSQIVCNDSEVFLNISPNPANVGQSMNFTISGDASTFINDSFSGGATNCRGPWNSQTCQASQPGSFTWTHTWRHCEGDTDHCSPESPKCSKSFSFTINQSAPASTCTISANPNPCTIPAGATVCSSTISWITNTNVDVKLVETGQLFAQSGSGSSSQNAAFITQSGFTFNCIDRSSGTVLNNVRVTGVSSACISDKSCSAPAPACGTTTTGVDNCGNSCTKLGVPCVQPPGGQSQSQSQSQSQTVNVTQAPAVALAAVPAGNVGIGTSQVLGVTTLPKTGLPGLAWSVLAFIPAGFRLRRFGKLKKNLEDDPNYIWEDRKFKAGS